MIVNHKQTFSCITEQISRQAEIAVADCSRFLAVAGSRRQSQAVAGSRRQSQAVAGSLTIIWKPGLNAV